MRQAIVDNLFWAASLAGESALIAVLLRKSRWKQFPFFTALIASPAVASSILLPVLHLGLTRWYSHVYWTFVWLNFLIQMGVVVELARIVLRPTGTWVSDARNQFLILGLAGAAIAFALAWFVAPPAPDRWQSFEVKANLFTSLLICELFLAMSLTANKLGLGWRSHVMAIGQGLTVWSTVAVIVDSLHSYLGAVRFYDSLELLKVSTYLGALVYWCFQLWQEEPSRRPISPELHNYILALHHRVEYDLGKAEQ